MKPVDTNIFKDYLDVVKHPKCFQSVDAKLKARGKDASYLTNESFIRDVRLIFQNCKAYNTDPVRGADICKLADTLADALDQLLVLNPPPETESKRTFVSLPQSSKKKKRSRDMMEALTGGKEPTRSSSRPQKRSRKAEEADFALTPHKIRAPSFDGASPAQYRQQNTTPRTFRSHFRASAFNVPAPKPTKEVFQTLTPDEKTMDKIISRLWKVCKEYPFASCFQIPFVMIDPSKRNIYLKKIESPMDFRTIKENIWSRRYLGVRFITFLPLYTHTHTYTHVHIRYPNGSNKIRCSCFVMLSSFMMKRLQKQRTTDEFEILQDFLNVHSHLHTMSIITPKRCFRNVLKR